MRQDNKTLLAGHKQYSSWCYYGVILPYEQALAYKKEEALGTCPLCKRTGLKQGYAGAKRHIISCLKKQGLKS